ncbi:MAG: two-component sensor histidine kinase, partial [Xanthomarina sp.]
MSKKLFVFLILLMSLSLVGIIFVQAYYINNSLKNEEAQFTFNVKKALSFTSRKIEDIEFKDYVLKFQDLLDQGVKPDTSAFREFYLKEEVRGSNEKLIYRNSVLEENYKLSSSIFDIGLDSINIQKVLSDRETKILKGSALESNANVNLDAMMFEFGKLSRGVEVFYDEAYEDLSYRVPIHKRVSKEEIKRFLKTKLAEDNIDIDFQFAIYSNDLATKIQTDDFELLTESTFSVPLFQNKNDISNYRLLVNFPKRNIFVQSSIIRMTLLSFIFTSIIIIAYASALLQLFKQRKISEIKTDFINNMTH